MKFSYSGHRFLIPRDFTTATLRLGLSVILSLGAIATPLFVQAATVENDAESFEDAQEHLRLGIDFFLTGELEIAIDEFREAARLSPGYADAYHNLGVVLAKTGDLTGAIAAWSQAQRLDPNGAPVHYHLSALVSYNYGVALLSQGQLDRAMAEWAAAQRIQPSLAEAHYAEGLGHLTKGDAPQAITKFQQALSWQPNWAAAYHQLGVAYYQNRDFRSAETAWRQALNLEPRLAQAQSNIGLARLMEGDIASAIESFHQAIALDPRLPEAHFNLGVAFYSRGEWAMAVEPLRQVLSVVPRFPAARMLLGVTWANLGQWGEATSEWREALRDHPPDFTATIVHFNMGLGLFMMGDLAGAITELRQAIALRPDWAEAHYRLGTVAVLAKKWALGLEHFQKVVKLKPSWAQAFFSLGKVHYQMGEVSQAIEALREATRLAPGFADAFYHLGVMLRAQNHAEEAIAPLQVAAKAGIEDAQSLLASMYANGSGVDQNIPMAMVWWARIATTGSSSESSALATERLSQLRRQVMDPAISSTQSQEIQTGFSLIRQALRQSVYNTAHYDFDESLGHQLIQHQRVSEAVPILIQEALALDDRAHAELERLYLTGIDGSLRPHDERIFHYFLSTADEQKPESCAFLKRVLRHQDATRFKKANAAVEACRSSNHHAS